MVKLIQDNYCVDTTQLFANGFSYGGGMSYAIACARAKVFRGVAIYDGAVLSGCEGGNDPIAYWQMAGLTDNVCTVDMAKPMRDRFVRNNGCTAQNPPQPPQPPPYLSPGGHVCTDYSGCSSGHPLRWCVHQSGHGNAIVDGTADLYNSCATPPKSCSTTCPCTWVPARRVVVFYLLVGCVVPNPAIPKTLRHRRLTFLGLGLGLALGMRSSSALAAGGVEKLQEFPLGSSPKSPTRTSRTSSRRRWPTFSPQSIPIA